MREFLAGWFVGVVLALVIWAYDHQRAACIKVNINELPAQMLRRIVREEMEAEYTRLQLLREVEDE